MIRSSAQGQASAGLHPAWIVVLAGVSAALHVGKLPPALPVLQQDLGITLVQAGFLLSLVQLASMALGIGAGLAGDSIGLRRSVLIGLWILFCAGVAGGFAQDAVTLLLLRAAEGVGFLMTTVPAPSLIRRVVERGSLTKMLSVWSAFMPFGTAMAFLLGPLVLHGVGWHGWWWLTAGLSGAMALWVQARVPADGRPSKPGSGGHGLAWPARLTETLRSPGPWLIALTFAAYSCQWLGVIGFLPSFYAQSGWTGALGAAMSALVAAVNMFGNVAAGRLLHRGVPAVYLLWAGFGAMAAGAVLAFSVATEGTPVVRYLGALLFSSVGGLIPGTLFGLVAPMAPNERTISTTVGWMMQWSAAGQLVGPPAVAWLASRVGGWQWTWAATSGCCVLGAVLAALIARRLSAPANA